MSDTPRTDAEEHGPGLFDAYSLLVPASFARELERELNAANEHLRLQEEHLSEVERENEQLKERIKRLEVAVDILEWGCIDPESVRDWRKAKEANP